MLLTVSVVAEVARACGARPSVVIESLLGTLEDDARLDA